MPAVTNTMKKALRETQTLPAISSYRGNRPTNKQTGPITIHCAAKLSAQCNETRSSADADNRFVAFSGQSRSTNMVPFHMLHIVSYCAIVTLSLRRAVFTIFVFEKFHDLEMGSKVTQGH